MGDWKMALEGYSASLVANGNNKSSVVFYQVYVHRSLLYYQLGNLSACLRYTN